MAKKYPDLTDLELEAIQAFAKQEGRRWKATLNEVYWYNARVWRSDNHPATLTDNEKVYGNVLHGLRNSHGPSWLMGFKLPKAPKPDDNPFHPESPEGRAWEEGWRP